jgi:hypothetical protein
LDSWTAQRFRDRFKWLGLLEYTLNNPLGAVSMVRRRNEILLQEVTRTVKISAAFPADVLLMRQFLHYFMRLSPQSNPSSLIAGTAVR